MSDDRPAVNCMVTLEVTERTRRIREACRCGHDAATQVLKFAGGYLVTDRSICDACGKVLWDWTWESTMAAAREAREACSVGHHRTVPHVNRKPKQMELWG